MAGAAIRAADFAGLVPASRGARLPPPAPPASLSLSRDKAAAAGPAARRWAEAE